MKFPQNTLRILFALIMAGACFYGAKGQHPASWYIANAPFKMKEIRVPNFPDKNFSIKDFGAVNDGRQLNTEAFAKAINACNSAGGGKVIVPAGSWLTGPIELKSNVNLVIEKGALIAFTKDHSQYPMIKASGKSSNIVPASPVYGYDLKNVAITGEGVIDGAGETWRPIKKMKTTAAEWDSLTRSGGVVSKDGKIWWPAKEAMEGEQFLKDLKQNKAVLSAEDYLPARDFLRPHLLYLVNCENILIENVTLRNSPKFIFYPNNCTNLTMRSVNVFNEWNAQNGDGIDISQCKNVLIYQCIVSAGDDGICMKSGSGKNNPEVFNLENVVVAECTVYRAHGGFVIGSNTDGGIQNVLVQNCHFIGSDIGVRVKSNAGRGGLVKNIFMRNIDMSHIKEAAISFDTFYEDVPAGSEKSSSGITGDKIPLFTHFYFDSITCNGAKTAVSITGLEQTPVRNVYFKNIEIQSDNGFIAKDATDLFLDHVKITVKKDPVYLLERVKNINIESGYFPPASKSFYKADKKSSGINISGIDLSR